ncbi:thioredoxin domain-containing protein [Nocardioides zeae]|uniref:Thioredoxin domain-containing protein n=1 Tax=Nocardioides imazamoxiresistens TaxID=3231893 RepID=A0ABU3PRU4_9ACTN|nr:thioredoxin domain-containing protein [Nocardioides zeae]MDT9591937.1 thioredoxin domain-containing protein [Nocardioides zeae]
MPDPAPDADEPSRAERADATRRGAARRERVRDLTVAGGVLLLVVLVLAAVLLITTGDDAPDEGDGADATPGAGALANSDLGGRVTSEHGIALGDDAAPHRVVVYEDLVSPAGAELAAALGDDLARAVDGGRAVVEYRPVAEDADAVRAANAFAVVLDSAGPRVANTFHDLLVAAAPDGQTPDVETLVDLAVVAGAVENLVRPGIDDLEFEQWVADGAAAARDAGVTGVPTVLLDGEPVTGSPAEVAAAVLAATG